MGQKAPRHALIVEDNQDLRCLYAFYLKKEGFSVAAAASGKEAIELAKSQTPDIVFLDHELPDMKGPEVAESLRKLLKRSPYMVALTGLAPDNIQEGELEKSGICRILQKPVSKSSLKELMDRV